ncbi:MAG: hypothetical protein Q4F67_00560 [Propionibacteriaceae bacterium]|nr:hypothetical protein [Propionibacteriaceae bacterium]
MEGLLHPVGPEDVRTYWIRRGAALAVLVVALIVIGTMISSIGRAEGPETEPAGHPPAASAPVDPAAGDPGEQKPPPADPADSVIDEEAVPMPASAQTAPATPRTTPTASPAPQQQQTPSASARPAEQEPLEPEPANTFHRTASPAAN